MRGDGLQLATVGAWLALAAVIVLGTAVLPKTQAWVDSAVGLRGTDLGPKFERRKRLAETACARMQPTDGLAASGHGELPQDLPKCWEHGLRLAASTGRRHWSPTKPPCRRRRGIHRLISMRSRRGTSDHLHALSDREHRDVAADPAEVREVALKLFEEIRGADYEQFLRGEPRDGDMGSRAFPAAHNDRRRLGRRRTSSRIFSGCPIQSIWVGEVRLDEERRPCVPYRLELTDGGVLAGDLAFEYVGLGRGGRWRPVEGIDWFLKGGAACRRGRAGPAS